eukprot:TRINITY_DN54776_c0_g1_i1.p1 TRINITY_DN54776_c0_g1~~TRINITY_DN54776_c0_g1_i1.p1  ORF type:complete len:261 (+),score=27.24 TRINITY_DN54776_c0_g1_i1:161-943(+)
MSVGLCSSVSEGRLRPLPPPQSLLTPIAWSLREPVEFAEQCDRLAARVAKSYLKDLYRYVREHELGIAVWRETEWPPYLPLPDRGKEVHPHPKGVYKPPPFRWDSNPAFVALPFKDSRPRLAKDPFVPTKVSVKKKQDTVKVMHSFGRTCHGAPCTLKQVYAEIEAKDRDRSATDTRAMSGNLGPAELGPCTTTKRRQMPFSFFASGEVRGGSSPPGARQSDGNGGGSGDPAAASAGPLATPSARRTPGGRPKKVISDNA